MQTAAVFTAAASCFLEKKRRRHHVALDEESERVLVAVTGNTGRTHAAVEGEADRHGDERFGFHRAFVLSRVEQTAKSKNGGSLKSNTSRLPETSLSTPLHRNRPSETTVKPDCASSPPPSSSSSSALPKPRSQHHIILFYSLILQTSSADTTWFNTSVQLEAFEPSSSSLPF